MNGLASQTENSSWKMASQRYGIVVNATNLSPSATCFKCISVQEILTDLTSVVTAHRSLLILTSCARMLSFTLVKSHSSADFVRGPSLGPRLLTTTSAPIQERGHSRATSATKRFHKHRNSASTRDPSMNVSLENVSVVSLPRTILS